MQQIKKIAPALVQKRNRLKAKIQNKRKNKADTISVVIPVYNGAKYIAEAIESVASQTILPVELIIVDDGSTDSSIHIVENLVLPFPLLILKQPNMGQGAARNNGANIAKGEYLAFLDQDDKWYPEHLQLLLKPFHKNNRLGWTYSNLDEINEAGELTNFGLLNSLPAVHPKRNVLDMLSVDMFILPSASLIKKKAFMAVGGFDPRLIGYEDDDLFLRLFREGYPNKYINESLSQWRIYGKSCSFSPAMAKSRRIYAEKLMQSFPDNANLSRFWVRDYVIPRFLHNSLGDFFAARANKEFDKCEIALADLCHYTQWAHPRTRMRLRLRAKVWNSRVKLARWLAKRPLSFRYLPNPSLWEGLVTSCFLP